MKVLVTGGLGFVGSHLVEALVKKGNKVNVIDNCSVGKLVNVPSETLFKITFEYDSVANPIIFQENFNYDVIFHLAATNLVKSVQDPQHDLIINTSGTLNVLEAMRKLSPNAIIVYASSGSVYGEPICDPQTEKHPTNPTSPYGISKLAAENYIKYYIKQHQLKAVILRYYNIVGPRQNYNDDGGVVPIFMKRMLQGKPLIIEGSGTQERVFTDVRDVVNATLLASEKTEAQGQTFNIATEKITSINTLAKKVQKLSTKKIAIHYTKPRIGDIQRFHPAIDQAKKLLGYTPKYTLEDSLNSVVEWMKCELHL